MTFSFSVLFLKKLRMIACSSAGKQFSYKFLLIFDQEVRVDFLLSKNKKRDKMIPLQKHYISFLCFGKKRVEET